MTNEITKNTKPGLVKIAGAMIWIVSRAALIIAYFVIFMPVGFIIRLIDRDPLERKLDPAANTYYRPSRVRAADHMDKPY